MKKYEKLAASFLSLLLIFTLATPQRVIADDVAYGWAKSIGGSSADIGYSTVVDSSGNVYTAGSFQGTVDFDPGAGTANLTSVGSSDVFILKLDSDGNYVWAKSMGGTSGAFVASSSALKIDSTNNIYIVGYFADTADFDPGAGTANLTSAGGFDIFISKFDSDGNYVWAKSMGGTNTDTGTGIALDSLNNVYATGHFFSTTADFDPGAGTANLTPVGGTDVFILKLDSDGNYVWAKSIGGTSGDTGSGITLDSSNNVYSTGQFSSTADFDPGAGTANLTSVGSSDVFILKLDSDGNYVWAKSMGGTSSDAGRSINSDSLGSIYTTGQFSITADFDPGAGTANLTSAGGFDIFISKLDSDGNYVWAKSIGGTSSDTGSRTTLDSSNNVYATGRFSSTADFDPGAGTANLTSAGGSDIFVSKLDSSGNYVWAKSMGGSSTDEGWSVALDTSGNVYTTGYFGNTADFDPGIDTANLTSVGNSDIFISKLTVIVNTAPTATSLSISGTPEYGQILTGLYTYTDADGDTEGTSTYRWLRDAVAIGGATSNTYTTTQDDVGTTLTFEVTPVASTGITTGTPYVSDGIIILAIVPTLTATASSNTTTTSVSLSSTVESTGGATVTERGFQYGTTDSYGSTVSETGSFSAGDYTLSLGNLSCGTTYYYRSFATNTAGTGVGEGSSVQTSACPGVAVVPPPVIVTPPPVTPPPAAIETPPDPVVEEIPPKEPLPPIKETPPVKEEIIIPQPQEETPPESQPIQNTQEEEGTTTEIVSSIQDQPNIQGGGGSTSAPTGAVFLPSLIQSFTSAPEIISDFSQSLRLAIQSDQPLQQILSADPVVVQTAETINTVVVATAVAVPLTGAVATSAYAFSDMFFTLLRLWNGALAALGIKRKRRPWGTVYDSQTKQPLDPAYVALTDSTGKEVASALTDIDGRYGFVVPAGQYTLSVRKTHYTFPSKKLSSSSDELYSNLYYGTPITVATDGAVIMHNIPLDRDGFDWNEYAKQTQGRLTFFRARDLLITRISSFFFIMGGILSLLSLLLVPTTLNIIVVCIYVLLALLRTLSRAGKAKGSLMTQEGTPLPFTILRFLSKETGQEVAHSVADRSGLYYALVPNGSYTLVVEEKREGGYERILTGKELTVKRGYCKEKVVI
jgi:hypothetical protein